MKIYESTIGLQSDKLTVIGPGFAIHDGRRNRLVAVAECTCGTIDVVRVEVIRSGFVGSCGCLQREAAAALNRERAGVKSPGYKHGGKGSALYSVWRGMLGRCGNPHATGYSNYGGRGIAVCEEWHEFVPFRDWALASGYRPSLEIDRRDNEGDYEPGNCRWVTIKNNARNRRTNVVLAAFGESKCIKEWAAGPRARAGEATIRSRVEAGWPAEKAIGSAARVYSRSITQS